MCVNTRHGLRALDVSMRRWKVGHGDMFNMRTAARIYRSLLIMLYKRLLAPILFFHFCIQQFAPIPPHPPRMRQQIHRVWLINGGHLKSLNPLFTFWCQHWCIAEPLTFDMGCHRCIIIINSAPQKTQQSSSKHIKTSLILLTQHSG